MLQKIRNSKMRTGLIFIAALGLVLIRVFEDQLFYDPFLSFFKQDFQNKPLPDFNGLQLFFGLLFRYLWNTLLSLVIIYSLFNQFKLVKFLAVLFVVLFLVLIAVGCSLLFFSDQPDYLVLFYIRRFIIQPLFLILFIPALYYQQITK